MAPGNMLIIAPQKSAESIKEKVKNEYAGDYSLVCDSVRCTVAADSLDDIPDAIKNLGKKVEMLFSKNRYERIPESGYRDATIYVRYDNGIIGEVQFLLKSMLIAREFKGGSCLAEAQCVFDAVYDSLCVPERVKDAIRKEHNELLLKLEKDA